MLSIYLGPSGLSCPHSYGDTPGGEAPGLRHRPRKKAKPSLECAQPAAGAPVSPGSVGRSMNVIRLREVGASRLARESGRGLPQSKEGFAFRGCSEAKRNVAARRLDFPSPTVASPRSTTAISRPICPFRARPSQTGTPHGVLPSMFDVQRPSTLFQPGPEGEAFLGLRAACCRFLAASLLASGSGGRFALSTTPIKVLRTRSVLVTWSIRPLARKYPHAIDGGRVGRRGRVKD